MIPTPHQTNALRNPTSGRVGDCYSKHRRRPGGGGQTDGRGGGGESRRRRNSSRSKERSGAAPKFPGCAGCAQAQVPAPPEGAGQRRDALRRRDLRDPPAGRGDLGPERDRGDRLLSPADDHRVRVECVPRLHREGRATSTAPRRGRDRPQGLHTRALVSFPTPPHPKKTKKQARV